MENSQQKSSRRAKTKQENVTKENSNQEDLKKENPNPKPKPKSPKILVYRTIQKTFAVAGVTPKLVTQAYPLNVKVVMGFILLNLMAIFNLIFTLCYAKTFAEYTQSIYVFSLVDLIIFALLIVIFKVEDLFKYVDTCCDIVNTSEHRN